MTLNDLNDLEETRVDIVGRNRQKTRQFHNDTTRPSDADDCALDAFERTFGDANFLSFMKLGGNIFQI